MSIKDIMLAGLSADWLALLDTAELNEIIPKLQIDDLCPAADMVFQFARVTPLADIRVILLGQDPYADPADACGLAFSVPKNRPIPPSLRAIADCIGIKPLHGYLGKLATQGVLLINTALTTTRGVAKAHSKIWGRYVAGLIDRLPQVPILAFGKDAQKTAVGKQGVLSWGHPSPLNKANRTDCPENFKYCPYFKQLDFINWDWDDRYYIFTDGGATANGKANCRAAWAYKILPGGHEDSGRVPPPASNNRGELLAIIHGIKRAIDTGCVPAICYSDSEYSIKSITVWYPTWVKKGIEKKNMDLIGEAHRLTTQHRITFVHVNSHQQPPEKTDPQYANKILIWQGNHDCDLACTRILNS